MSIAIGAAGTVQPLQEDITRNCPEKIHPHYPAGKCAPLMPDLWFLSCNQLK
jgi:hypothetical protein